MKKIALIVFSIVFLFAANSDDINKKLDLLIQKINQLEKKVDSKDAEIDKLKKEINSQQKEIKTNNEKVQKEVKSQIAVKSCKNVKVISLKYEYHNDVIPYYYLTFTLKNTYPKKIVYLSGNLFAEDKDRVKILQDYIKRDIEIPAGGEVTITKTHTLNSDMEKYLKDENPKDLKVYFEVIKAEFADGTNVECGF